MQCDVNDSQRVNAMLPTARYLLATAAFRFYWQKQACLPSFV